MKWVAFNINFDSLGQQYGFPRDYDDPSFTTVAERFFKISDRYGFKYSIFVIGRDLEKAKNRDCVKRWADQGHEIGSHSWSHPLNLGAMSVQGLREEVSRAHEIIARTTGSQPKGFIAPGWSNSDALMRELIEHGYDYDTSAFPSWLIYPSLAKMLLNHLGSEHFFTILHRKDLLTGGAGNRQAYVFEKKLIEIPLPTNRWRMALWHTLYFVFGARFHESLIRQCLDQVNAFYYLMHPGDLIDARDLARGRSLRMERVKPGLEQKTGVLERAIELILKSGRKAILMRDMAQKLKNREM